MDRKQMAQILVPALAAAGMIVLVGVLVATSSWSDTPPTTAKGKAGGPGGATSSADATDKGMADSIPPLDAPEWKALPDGMRYWDVKEGEGDACPAEATVTIHYTGWTTDGQKFDSSRGKGAPATFPLSNLIKGWQEGIPGMKPGGIRRLDIPYQLGYGESGSRSIPPKAQLVFEVKLISFQ